MFNEFGVNGRGWNKVDLDFVIYNGYFYWAFWYVPFIMLVFCFSPIFIKFITISFKYKLYLLSASFFISFALGRHNLNPFLSAIYWSSTYFAGILFAIYYDKFINLLSVNFYCFFCMTILYLSFLISWDTKAWFSDFQPYEIKLFSNIDFILIGKICLSVVFIRFFLWLKTTNLSFLSFFKYILNILAKYSFSIFFLHQFAILTLERNYYNYLSNLNFYEMNVVAFLISIIICFICICVAIVIKFLTRKYSRMIIGS